GDRIAVGVSGGKDSLSLLRGLSALREFNPAPFELTALTVDPGFDTPLDLGGVEEFCRKLGVGFTVVPTNIFSIVFKAREESNPCSLCAKMRRGALDRAAVGLGCNKLALGHHADDVIDTFMLNLLHGGKIDTFSPVTSLDRSGITLIRPMIYVREKELSGFVKKAALPVVKSPCPVDRHTQREEMKNLILEIEKTNRDVKSKLFGAICRSGVGGFKERPDRAQKG
ncbi:MAG: tRNA 2-thiocytidine biosynthesis protein TtcA, partial [Clostridia bacterium]|nr:tRNA 2-thiocytidine biosynthesis protein TtcA [Clostridia bacterium]